MGTADNKILDRILNDARAERKAIIETAKKSAKMLVEKQRRLARHNAEKEVDSILKRAENEADVIKGKVITNIERQAGWLVLSEKERLVTNVLNEAKNRLLKLQKSEDYLLVLEKLILDAGLVLGGGTLEVVLNENDSPLALKLNKLERKIANATSIKTRIIISKQQIKAVGVIVRTVDGRIFVDNTFEAIIQRREKELRSKIARILFSGASAS
jgi:vacuolar-type H+-ATPase subunit E/Vma4